MKRAHVHLSVPDPEPGVRFYSGPFGTAPAVPEPDCAKWMPEGSRVRLAISSHGRRDRSINPQDWPVESSEELAFARDRFAAADAQTVVEQHGASGCCAGGAQVNRGKSVASCS